MVLPKIFDKTDHLPLIKTLSKLVQETSLLNAKSIRMQTAQKMVEYWQLCTKVRNKVRILAIIVLVSIMFSNLTQAKARIRI